MYIRPCEYFSRFLSAYEENIPAKSRGGHSSMSGNNTAWGDTDDNANFSGKDQMLHIETVIFKYEI